MKVARQSTKIRPRTAELERRMPVLAVVLAYIRHVSNLRNINRAVVVEVS